MTEPQRQPDGTLVLDAPVVLPPVLDVLIVGGGPAGTACAFRAKELGLAALVVDMDDLLKRIRDYAADKPLLPDFGGGDTMQFPAGGALVEALRFEPIGKDAMVETWKGLYRRFNVPAQVGVELLHLERRPDGAWRADTRNHYTKQPHAYLAKNVVLALGRGVPRRLDISGNVQDLANRLDAADRYVGAPACVIGGGTSAAEAVIAISNAKAQSGRDTTPVYWSYRGRFVPKVPQSLASDLFDVLMVNGNLRFALGSEPVAVTERDGVEYLAVCTAVTDEPGLPREIVQLEFRKAFSIACIGADRPDGLLRKVGVEFVPRESGDSDRIVVSPLLGARRAGLFLAGDVLSPDYAEAAGFDDDPSTFTVKGRRGNIKSALRDGVLLAEIIRQRIDGREDIRVVIPDAGPAATMTKLQKPKAHAAVEPHAEPSPGRLVALLADGTPADEFPLVGNGLTTIGREGTTVLFPHDSMLSARHASILHGPGGLELRDLGSEHGVFIKAQEGRAIALAPATVLKVGGQWIVPQETGGAFEIVHSDGAGKRIARYRITEGATLVLGRAAPSTVLDPNDSTLSRRHISLSHESGQLLLRDLGSRNGTYVKVHRRWTLEHGDLIWIGHQLLRVDIGDGRPSGPAVIEGKVPASAPSRRAAAHPPTPAHATVRGPSVTFGPGHTFPFTPGSTLLDVALVGRVRIKYECKTGDCGKCRVDVVSGADGLDAKSAKEQKALRAIGRDDATSRLACLVTAVRGPIVVQVPK